MTRKELGYLGDRMRLFRTADEEPCDAHWYGASIDAVRKGRPIVFLREWRGWPLDLDVPLPPKPRPVGAR